MEPAAVLVGSFKIEIGRAFKIPSFLKNKGMGGAGVKPYIKDVGDLLVILGIVVGTQETAGVRRKPAIGPLFAHRRHDAVDHGLVTKRLAGRLVDKDGDRHAPGTLARQAPVGSLFDHRGQAALTCRRVEGCPSELRHGGITEAVRLHRNEPLRRVAVDQRCFRTPGMRIGMHKLADPYDPAMLGHDLGDPLVVTQHVKPGEDRQVRHQLAVFGNRVWQWNAMFEVCEFVILHTMSRRDVDKACSLIGGHIVGEKHRHVMLITMAVHRVLRDRPLDVGALKCRQRFGAGDADGAGDLAHELGGKADDVALARQSALIERRDPKHRVIDVRAAGHGPVAWHRPWRGCPDDDIRALKGGMAWRLHGEAGIDRDRGVVLIFDLGLGKRRFLDRRPHHRLRAAIKAAVHQQPAQLAGNRGLRLESHCGV